MEDGQTETLLSRVIKLMAMAESSTANPGEAANAVALAEKLIYEHNLSEAAIAARRGKTAAANYDLVIMMAGEGDNLSLMQRRHLMHIICSYHFCRVSWPGREDTTRAAHSLNVVGQPDNIAVVEYLYDYLTRALARLCDRECYAAYKAAKKDHPPLKDFTPVFAQAFYAGATAQINRRLYAQQQASLDDFDTQAKAEPPPPPVAPTRRAEKPLRLTRDNLGDFLGRLNDDIDLSVPVAPPHTDIPDSRALAVIITDEVAKAEEVLIGKLNSVCMDEARQHKDPAAYKRGYVVARTLNLNRPLLEGDVKLIPEAS